MNSSSGGEGARSPDSSTLRVLSYNIHKGFSAGNRRFVLEKLREAIRAVGADVVLLQEVLGDHRGHAETIEGWPELSQFEYLADELWPHFAYGKNAVYSAGHHGNAVLSRFPIVAEDNFNISTNVLEQRGILHAVVEPKPGCRLHLLCTHLNLLESGRFHQIRSLCNLVWDRIPHEDPLLIGGDFNDWKGRISRIVNARIQVHEVFEVLHGRHAKTFPSRFPLMTLDRIYFRGLDPRAARVLRGDPWARLSDHVALCAEFEVGGGYLSESPGPILGL